MCLNFLKNYHYQLKHPLGFKAMTKKDYILIADVIRTVYEAEHNMLLNHDTSKAIRVLAKMLTEGLARENTRFDKEKFLKACGIID